MDEEGEKVWGADTSIYGELRNLQGEAQACPFRYPGQYEDVETGLYYNRFRYYDREGGEYLSQDPLGVSAKNPNLYAYVHDPNTWVDILGLSCKNAASNLPQLKGKSIPQVEKTLKKNDFKKIKDNGINQTWRHADGSEVRVHKYGNAKEAPYKSANNAHVHKQDPSGNQLTDRGLISSDPNETHIGIKNPKDLPVVRGRSHGAGVI